MPAAHRCQIAVMPPFDHAAQGWAGQAVRVIICRTTDELDFALRAEKLAAVACDVFDAAGVPVAPVLAMDRGGLNAGLPTAIACSLSPAAVHELLQIAAKVLNIRVAINGFDSLDRVLQHLVGDTQCAFPHSRLIREAFGLANSDARQLIVGALMMGSEKRHVAELARAFAVSERTLERKADATALPKPKELLDWSFALHALWRIERMQWPRKRAAALAGFADTHAFAIRLSRHFARAATRRPEELRFEDTLTLFQQRLRLRSDSRKSDGKPTHLSVSDP